jgi:glucan 1,3-beta-glucosidase
LVSFNNQHLSRTKHTNINTRPDTDAQYAADLAIIKQYAPQYTAQVYAVTVGSETLYRGSFTGPTLASKISAVKSALGGGIKVGTADSWNKWADGTGDAVIQGGADIILANAFGFWQSSPIANASHVYFDDVSQAFQHIQNIAGGPGKIEVWTGETGWPTGKCLFWISTISDVI